MIGNYLKALLIGSISVLFTSCIAHYIPPPVNNPMLSRESECQINASIATGEYGATGNLNLAYSPKTNIGATYSYSSYNTSIESTTNGASSTDKLSSGKYNELMFGYYKGFSTHGLLELYAGMGIGNSDNNYLESLGGSTNNNGNSKLNYTRLSFTPAIGYKAKNFQSSLSFKLYQVDFNGVKTTNISDVDLLADINLLKDKPYYFIDNALTLKFGTKNLQLLLQFASTNKLSGNFITYEQFRIVTGIQFQFYANP